VIQGAALVTGAGDRLGRAMAVRLAEMGLDVAVHYGTNKAGAEETVRLIERAGQTACVLQADLTDMDQAEALVDQAVASMGQLSVLINNASVFEYDNLSTATRESWSRHINFPPNGFKPPASSRSASANLSLIFSPEL
jgi:NAD(P)-dependent dehydrogenase (short-subunit alcohol dehydrogenase family)